MSIKKIIGFALFFLIFFGSISPASAASEPHRYLIYSSSKFIRKAVGGVHHDFGNSFSVDGSALQLRIAKMFGASVEKVDVLHVSALAPITSEEPLITPASSGDIKVAVLDSADGHGKSIVDIITKNASEQSDINLYPVCNDQGLCYADDVAAGLYSAIDDGARLINMSFGSDNRSEIIDAAIQEAHGRGIIMIAAAGNSGPFADSVQYPASHPDVVAVGALTRKGEMASWSSRGDIQAWELGESATMAGTSVAAAYYTAAETKHIAP